MNINEFIQVISTTTDDGYVHMEANRDGFWVMYQHRGVAVSKLIDYGRYPLWAGCAEQIGLLERLHKLPSEFMGTELNSFDLNEFFADYTISPDQAVMRIFEYPEDFGGDTWTVVPHHEWDKLYRAALVALKSKNPVIYFSLSPETDIASINAISPSCQYNAALVLESKPVELVLPARAIALFEATGDVTIQTSSSQVYLDDGAMTVIAPQPQEVFRRFPEYPTGKNETLWFERDTLIDAVDRATAHITAKGHGIWLHDPDCNQIRMWTNKPNGLLHIVGEQVAPLRPIDRYGDYESSLVDLCGVALLDVLNALSTPTVGITLPALCKKQAMVIHSGESSYYLFGIISDKDSAKLYNLNKSLGNAPGLYCKPERKILEQNSEFNLVAVEESPLEGHYPQWKLENNLMGSISNPELLLIDELSDLFEDFLGIVNMADDIPPDKRPPRFNEGVAMLLEIFEELQLAVNAPYADDCLTAHYLTGLRDRVIWSGGRMLKVVLNLPETYRIEVVINQN